MAKDAKHLAIVGKAKGDFIPLVVESFDTFCIVNCSFCC